MARFEDYANKYQTIKMERRDGVLQMTFHTDGGPLLWGGLPHGEFPQAFKDVGSDARNKVIIMTGTGEVFSKADPARMPARLELRPRHWDRVYWEGKQLLNNLLDIEVPMISAINGPALSHSEMPLLCDIVLASEDAVLQDAGHFPNDTVPADGVHIVYPMLLGMNRGRYFLLTGQAIGAQEAQRLGLVAEVLPREKLMPRAWELAEHLAQKPQLLLRYTRVALTQAIKRQMVDLLGYGLILEGMNSAEYAAEVAEREKPGS